MYCVVQRPWTSRSRGRRVELARAAMRKGVLGVQVHKWEAALENCSCHGQRGMNGKEKGSPSPGGDHPTSSG